MKSTPRVVAVVATSSGSGHSEMWAGPFSDTSFKHMVGIDVLVMAIFDIVPQIPSLLSSAVFSLVETQAKRMSSVPAGLWHHLL